MNTSLTAASTAGSESVKITVGWIPVASRICLNNQEWESLLSSMSKA